MTEKNIDLKTIERMLVHIHEETEAICRKLSEIEMKMPPEYQLELKPLDGSLSPFDTLDLYESYTSINEEDMEKHLERLRGLNCSSVFKLKKSEINKYMKARREEQLRIIGKKESEKNGDKKNNKL